MNRDIVVLWCDKKYSILGMQFDKHYYSMFISSNVLQWTVMHATWIWYNTTTYTERVICEFYICNTWKYALECLLHNNSLYEKELCQYV